MNVVVIPTDDFVKELKRISKKQKSILTDIASLSTELKGNPTMGTNLGQNFYKIRMAISGSGKGKSGGAGVITYLLLDDQTVLLVEIYLKSEHDTTDVNVLFERLKDAGVI